MKSVFEAVPSMFTQRTLTIGVSKTMAGLKFDEQENMLLFVSCSKATEYKPVKLESSHTVILPPVVSVRWFIYTLLYVTFGIERLSFSFWKHFMTFETRFVSARNFVRDIFDRDISNSNNNRKLARTTNVSKFTNSSRRMEWTKQRTTNLKSCNRFVLIFIILVCEPKQF